MFTWKKKILAQRKFAQGTVVNQPAPSTTSTSNERRAVESNDRSVHIYNNNTSASRLLDEVAFRHPGMHADNLTINFTKRPESDFNKDRVIIPSTSRTGLQENTFDDYLDESQCVEVYHHSYYLRSCSKMNATKKVSNTQPNNRATSKKRGKPRNKSRSQNRIKPKRPIRAVYATCSEDEQPLSQYRRSKIKKTAPYNPKSIGSLVFEEDLEEGYNNRNDAMIDTSEENLLEINNTGPFVYRENQEEDINNTEPSVHRENEEEGNNDVNGAMIRTLVRNLYLDSENKKEPIIIPSGVKFAECFLTPRPQFPLAKSEDYENDLFIRESTDDHMHISDFPNLGNEELPFHDPDVDLVVKEEEKPTTSNERSQRAIAGPSRSSVGVIEEAPVFHPTEEEFNDPLVFYNKIQLAVTKYGICKVVPPEGFEPKCCLKNLTRVSATHQYIGRLFKRWGPGTREMCAIRAQLASHNVAFTRPPLIDGLEVDLPKMFQTVQKYGGFLEVTQKQLWTRVAEDMNYFKILNPGKRLDQMYVKYLLPYDIMKAQDREVLHSKIESVWEKKHNKLLKQAKNPVQLENLILGDSDSSSDEEYTSEEENINEAMYEIPNNDKTTRPILLMNFHNINYNAGRTLFPQNLHGPPVEEAEALYWSKVSQATDHICVYTASVDTADGGHGFSTEGEDIISKHKWNLKNFQHNEANVLKALGPIVSVTSPVLTMGMIFSTHCWHKDPHGLPWVEYHHEGKPKIWYAIPDMRSRKFRKTVEKLCPTVVQNKLLWLPSDLLMIPPDLLLQEGVSLTKTIQHPGEYIFVLPNAYTSSICTGITISESVYFAEEAWLNDINEIFLKLYKSCEPMMLPQEQLLISLATDHKTTPNILKIIYSSLLSVLDAEKRNRSLLDSLGIVQEITVPTDDYTRNWNSKDKECDICRAPFFFSKIMGRFKNQTISKMCIKHSQKIRECILSEEWSMTLVIYISDEFINSLVDKFSNKLQM